MGKFWKSARNVLGIYIGKVTTRNGKVIGKQYRKALRKYHESTGKEGKQKKRKERRQGEE